MWKKLKRRVSRWFVKPVDPLLEKQADEFLPTISGLSQAAQLELMKDFVRSNVRLVGTRAVKKWAYDNRAFAAKVAKGR